MRLFTKTVPAAAVRAALAAASLLAAGRAHAAAFTPFSFVSNTSTSGPYDPNRDVRLDSVTFGGNTVATLQPVSGATILIDDGVDAARGGGNFAAGRAPNSVSDTWAGEGPATVTPTSADLRDALGNFNLTSLAITRENVGTAALDVTFATPTNTFFFWERGSGTAAGNSDLLVEALDAQGKTTAAYKILRQNYTDTGLVVSTDVGAFTVSNVRLGSIGLQLDQPTDRLRLVSTQSANFKDDGPDYKVIASSAALSPVPEPTGIIPLGLAGGSLLLRRRRA